MSGASSAVCLAASASSNLRSAALEAGSMAASLNPVGSRTARARRAVSACPPSSHTQMKKKQSVRIASHPVLSCSAMYVPIHPMSHPIPSSSSTFQVMDMIRDDATFNRQSERPPTQRRRRPVISRTAPVSATNTAGASKSVAEGPPRWGCARQGFRALSALRTGVRV